MRALKYVLLGTILLGVLVAISISWLLYTTSGAQFILQQLSNRTDAQLEVVEMDGSFADGVTLKQLLIDYQGTVVTVDSAAVNITLNSVYPLRVVVEPMLLQGLNIQLSDTLDSAADAADPDQPSFPQIRLPRLEPFFDYFEIQIVAIKLQDLHVERNGQSLFNLSELHTTLHLAKRVLTVDLLRLTLPELQLAGLLRLDMAQTTLTVAGDIVPYVANSVWQNIEFDARFEQAKQLTGDLTANLTLHNIKPVSVQAALTFDDDHLQIRPFTVTQLERSGSIQGSGTLSFPANAPLIDASVTFNDLDLSAEIGTSLTLLGELHLVYTNQQYQGRLDLATAGSDLVTARVDAAVSGDHQQLQLSDLQGDWLAAAIHGNLQAAWQPELRLGGDISLDGLSTDPFGPGFDALLSARLRGRYALTAAEHQASLTVDLVDSLIHDIPVTGRAQLSYEDNNLLIEELNLRSKGLDLQAQGSLNERIDYQLRSDDLADFHTDISGKVTASGWLRWDQEGPTGQFLFDGRKLDYQQWQLDHLQGEGSLDAEQRVDLSLTASALQHSRLALPIEHILFSVTGTLPQHQARLQISDKRGNITADLSGGWLDPAWQGNLTRLELNLPTIDQWALQAPTALLISTQEIKASSLSLTSSSGQNLRFQGVYDLVAGDYVVDLSWADLSLTLLDLIVEDQPFTGASSGVLRLAKHQQNHDISASMTVTADLQHPKISLQNTVTTLDLDWDPAGLDGDLSLRLDDQSGFSVRFFSPEPAGKRLPDVVDISVQCHELPLALLRSWLPPDFVLDGLISCDSSGSWSRQAPMTLSGRVAVNGGEALWHDMEQSVTVAIQTAELNWRWRDAFVAELALIHDFGRLKADFMLPIEAHWPLTFSDNTPFTASVEMFLSENGLLSSLFPQQIQYSSGQLDLDIKGQGTIGNPDLTGSIKVRDAEFYLPAAGIRIDDIHLVADLKDQLLTIEQLRLASDSGAVTGQGQLVFQNWQPASYRLDLTGDRFQLVNLPHLMVRISPQLQLAGDLQQINVRGAVVIPVAMVKDRKKRGIIKNSADLIIVDRPIPISKPRTIRHDVNLQLVMGEQVLVDVAGLEAKVGGTLQLFSKVNQDVAATGQLQVERGRFSSYGVSLDIERGDLYYTGGSLLQPTLDVLALRRIGQVQAGVRATGTPQEPIVALYSQPVMPDADILAYIVLGRPMDAGGENSDLLATAAGALLSQGESIVLQEKLKSRLGLDVLDFSAGGGEVSEPVVTTGKYLTPELYVSLGYSLFTNTNEVKIRYRLTPEIDIESNFGVESGVDLYYRFEFE